MNTRQEISANFKGPKSVCQCGHAGDVGLEGVQVSEDAASGQAINVHGGLIGHGACTVPGCKCQKFSWADFTQAFARALAGVAK